MKTFNEDDLIAYHLQELSPRRERVLQRALKRSPELSATSESIAATLGLFKDESALSLDEAVVARMWQELRPSLPIYLPRTSSQPLRWRMPALVGMGLAAVVTALLFVTTHTQPRQETAPVATKPNFSTQPSPKAMEPTLNLLAPSTVRRSSLTLVATAGLLVPHMSAQELPLSLQGQTATLMAGDLIPFSSSTMASMPIDPIPATPQPVRNKPRTETSISLGTAAQLAATRLANPSYLNEYSAQSFDPSIAILGTLRQSFRPWLGYSVNMGYTRTTEHNVYAAPNPQTRFDIPYNAYELSLAYLLQKHLTPKLSGFANLGGGVLDFLPVHRGADAVNYVPKNTAASAVPANLARAMGVAGVGVDYRLTSHLAVRAEYRGLLYKYPDDSGIVPRAITVSSQPTLSLSYTFGRKRN